jgi:3D (Asp-Asp-Asp) domain-containing protein
MKEAKNIFMTTLLIICVVLSIGTCIINIQSMSPQKVELPKNIFSGDTLVIENNSGEVKSGESPDLTFNISREKEKSFLTYYTITNVNIRQEPSLDAKVIKTLPINTEILIDAETANDTWSKVKIDNNYFFIYNQYISTEKVVIKKEIKKESSGSNENLLGYFTLTYYCPCSKCCGKYASGITASGTTATAGRTIATSSQYAFGTQMIINGHTYTVEDRGGAIKGNKIDIYVDSHEEALKLGKKTNVPVYLAQ